MNIGPNLECKLTTKEIATIARACGIAKAFASTVTRGRDLAKDCIAPLELWLLVLVPERAQTVDEPM